MWPRTVILLLVFTIKKQVNLHLGKLIPRKIKNDFFASAIYLDVQLTPTKKKKQFSISLDQDIEINQHTIVVPQTHT